MPEIDAVQLNGSNWQDLNRLVAQGRLAFIHDDDD